VLHLLRSKGVQPFLSGLFEALPLQVFQERLILGVGDFELAQVIRSQQNLVWRLARFLSVRNPEGYRIIWLHEEEFGTVSASDAAWQRIRKCTLCKSSYGNSPK